jgi:hypothetical protein
MNIKTPTIYIKSVGPEATFAHLGEEFERVINEGLEILAEEIEWEIRRKAAGELNESRQAYLDGLSVLYTGGKIEVVVDGGLAVAVESGSKPHDISAGSRFQKTVWFKPPNRHFRNVSGKPTVTGKNWIHPGIKAHDFIGKVADDVENRLAGDIFDEVIQRIKV